uniref:Uncharacterized protein n=1 Tax=Utricularia reniformis TaxID=192314 RepID=A0A1Y0B0F0_9LAMI|nr:hypothetical protein AEK19_MT0642 [Utricularia reniformis]ART30895.1 hypothetical protein AEK19_MT0642 [Utricularia reniformis]
MGSVKTCFQNEEDRGWSVIPNISPITFILYPWLYVLIRQTCVCRSALSVFVPSPVPVFASYSTYRSRLTVNSPLALAGVFWFERNRSSAARDKRELPANRMPVNQMLLNCPRNHE